MHKNVLHKYENKSDDKIKFFYTNANSLKNDNNFSLFSTLMNLSQPDVIATVESWLNPRVSDAKVTLPNYTLIRADRGLYGGGGGERFIEGGGIACYIKNSKMYKLAKKQNDQAMSKAKGKLLQKSALGSQQCG